ncbi:unnamed protein product, partial [Ectocarpus sp. 6 AP-2014]
AQRISPGRQEAEPHRGIPAAQLLIGRVGVRPPNVRLHEEAPYGVRQRRHLRNASRPDPLHARGAQGYQTGGAGLPQTLLRRRPRSSSQEGTGPRDRHARCSERGREKAARGQKADGHPRLRASSWYFSRPEPKGSRQRAAGERRRDGQGRGRGGCDHSRPPAEAGRVPGARGRRRGQEYRPSPPPLARIVPRLPPARRRRAGQTPGRARGVPREELGILRRPLAAPRPGCAVCRRRQVRPGHGQGPGGRTALLCGSKYQEIVDEVGTLTPCLATRPLIDARELALAEENW